MPDNVPNNAADITDQCVRQLIFYLHATCLLDSIRPDDLAKTHETLKALAKEAGIDLKDPDNGKIREHMKTATKQVLEQAGLIEKDKNGRYSIPNEQLYKDTMYNIQLRLERERALHAMLKAEKKITEKVLKVKLGILKSDPDIAERVNEILRENDGILKFAEEVVKSAKSDQLEKAIDFMAEDYMRDAMMELRKHAKETAEKISEVVPEAYSIGKTVLEKARKVSEEQYKAITQVRANEKLYGETTDETVKKAARIWRQDDNSMARLVDGAIKLARLDHDIPMLEGFLDAHKELFPNMPKLAYEDISDAAKEKLGDKRNCWQISLVNGAKSFYGSMLSLTRSRVVSALEKLQPAPVRQRREGEFKKHFWRNAAISLLQQGDAWLRSRYESVCKGTYKMDDICMEVYDLRLKDLAREDRKTPMRKGAEFAKAFSECNLWRCGISKNIPGWFRFMAVSPQDAAWTLAYLKAGMTYSEEGVQWDSKLAESKVEGVYHSYMHGETSNRNWKQDLKNLEDSLIHEHEVTKEKMEQLRERNGRTKLSVYSTFNPELANEKEREQIEECCKMNEAEYKNADIDLVKQKYHHLLIAHGDSVSMMEFPDLREDLDKVDAKKLDNIKHTAVTGILGRNGYCTAMKQNVKLTDHTRNTDDSKRMTLLSNHKTAVVLKTQEIGRSISDEMYAVVCEKCEEMANLGYTMEANDREIIFTDPDGISGHNFSVRFCTESMDSASSRYAQKLKDELLSGLQERYELREVVLTAKEMEHQMLYDPMYRFAGEKGYVKRAQSENLLKAVRSISDTKTEAILDPEQRDRKIAHAERLLGRLNVEAIQTEQTVYFSKMSELKELAHQDPELAWCKMVAPDCERTEKGIVGHAPDGELIGIAPNGEPFWGEHCSGVALQTLADMKTAISYVSPDGYDVQENIMQEPELSEEAELEK